MSNRKTPIEGGNYEKWGSLSRAILTACRSQDSSNRSRRSRSWREFCQLEVSCSRTFQRQNLTLKRSLSVNDYRKCQYMKLTLLWFIYIRNAVLSPSETKPSQNLKIRKIRKKLRVVIISEEMVLSEATRLQVLDNLEAAQLENGMRVMKVSKRMNVERKRIQSQRSGRNEYKF